MKHMTDINARRQLINELQNTVSQWRRTVADSSLPIKYAEGLDTAYGGVLDLLDQLEQDCDLADEGNESV